MNKRVSENSSNAEKPPTVDKLAIWDFAENFTAVQATALICGVGDFKMLGPEKQPVLDRMESAFEGAKNQLHNAFMDADISFDGDPIVEVRDWNPLHLHSLNDDVQRANPTIEGIKFACFEAFDDAKFGRVEIHRWLQAINGRSHYSFALPEQTYQAAVDDNKPLGTRERDTLLTIIAALAKEAKIGIDSPGKAAQYIEGLTDSMGAHVSKRAIEEHLKTIPNAVATRMK